MGRRLPPLNSLRAFEAAARCLSFARAADALHVTPAAISHQIRALEKHLGVPLFRRLNRAVLLTDAGQACLPGLSEAFDRMAAVLERLRAQDGGGPLTVSTAPAFAARWLVPRLGRFQERCPEIDVRVSAAMRLVDFAREDVDRRDPLRAGPLPWPARGAAADQRGGAGVCPGAAPGRLSSPQDLRHHTLLHDDTATSDGAYPNWAMWLRAAGVEVADASRGPRFDYSGLVLDAAAAGAGSPSP